MKRKFRIFAAALAALSVISVSGCAISAAIEEENGFKYNSSQVSIEKSSDVTLHDMPSAPSVFGNIAAPSIFSDYTEKPYGIVEGDIYVSVNGSDETGDGSKSNPYATVEKAQSVIRTMKAEGKLPSGGLTVSIMAGEYRLSEGLVFTEEDSGNEYCPITYAAYGDGEVVFKGTVKLNASDFTSVGDDIKEILPDSSKDKVLMIDLSKYGITKDQLTLYFFENRNEASYYGYPVGYRNVELYIDRAGYDLARYPNEGEEWLITRDIVSKGERGVSGGILKINQSDLERVKNWHSLDNVCAMGTFMLDYNVTTTPVSFDFDNTTMILLGSRADSEGRAGSGGGNTYFFYNVLDELDIPGEWYIDRENCVMYVYPKVELADAEIELLVDFSHDLLKGENCSNVNFKGLIFIGSQAGGILWGGGSDCMFDTCKVYGVAKIGIDIYDGFRDTIYNCEVHYVGSNGIKVAGGVKETLTFGEHLIENCYVTHWAMYKRSYCGAINCSHWGNYVRHCEAAYSSASALQGGGFSIIEYNLFHDCASYVNDTAQYNGSSLTRWTTAFRYNIFYNIGENKYWGANGLFFDDGMCGQTAYGNLFVNMTGQGVSYGGGFANNLVGNIFINTMKEAIYYDQRMYNGFHAGSDFYRDYMISFLTGTPVNSQPWLENAVWLSQALIDIDGDTGGAHFYANPAFGLISDNLFLNSSSSIGNIRAQVRQYTTFQDNYTGNLSTNTLESIFVDPAKGDYRIREDAPIWDVAVDFKDIPYHLIGRY